MRSSGSSGPRVVSGDPLRALAALAVVLSHVIALPLLHGMVRADATGQPIAEGLPAWSADAGQALAAAVWVFFALSGFLLGRPFARALLGGRPLPSLRRYARNRALRIVPAFWAVVAITLLVQGPGPGDDLLDVLAIPAFLQTWRPSEVGVAHLAQAWSLDVEMAFYIALPLLAACALALPRRPWVLVAALAALGLASLAVRVPLAGDPRWLQSLPGLFAAFVPGLVLAVAEPWLARVLPARPRATRAVAAVLTVAGIAAFVAATQADLRVVRQAGLLAAGGGALLAAALLRELALRPFRLLVHPALAWLGERSYSLFLVHLLVLDLLVEATSGAPAGTMVLVLLLAGVPTSVLAAWALHAAVERPFLRRRSRPAATAPAVAVA